MRDSISFRSLHPEWHRWQCALRGPPSPCPGPVPSRHLPRRIPSSRPLPFTFAVFIPNTCQSLIAACVQIPGNRVWFNVQVPWQPCCIALTQEHATIPAGNQRHPRSVAPQTHSSFRLILRHNTPSEPSRAESGSRYWHADKYPPPVWVSKLHGLWVVQETHRWHALVRV